MPKTSPVYIYRAGQKGAALDALLGRNPGGVWQLRVVDRASRDEGKLNRWRREVFA